MAFRAHARLNGLHLVASDTDWSAGTGARVEGPIEAIVLLLTGRTAVALNRLHGAGSTQLTTGDPPRGNL